MTLSIIYFVCSVCLMGNVQAGLVTTLKRTFIKLFNFCLLVFLSFKLVLSLSNFSAYVNYFGALCIVIFITFI